MVWSEKGDVGKIGFMYGCALIAPAVLSSSSVSISINHSVRSPLPTNSDKLSPATPLNVPSDDEQSIVCDVEHS